MADPTVELVRDVLRRVPHPTRGSDVVSLGLISGLVVKGAHVGFTLEVDPREARGLEPLRLACERAVRALPGVVSCTAVLTAERSPGAPGGERRPAPPAASPSAPSPSAPSPSAPSPSAAGPSAHAHPRASGAALGQGLGSIVAVASGKGGVGKSTTAVNLALALSLAGRRVGLLDADIYGPSIPRMTGLSGEPASGGDKKLVPFEVHGVEVMSMGFLVPADTPMIWRGPMVQSAIQQLLTDVAWGPLDIMVIDLPPGTGDAQLTIAQRVPLKGAVIVSTPQDIALLDARKAIAMFRKVDVPILGVVENMSYFDCPACGHRTDIFAHGGARACAAELGVPFLGEIPLDLEIRVRSDEGRPIVVSAPESPQAAVYRQIAAEVLGALEGGAGGRPAPRIVLA